MRKVLSFVLVLALVFGSFGGSAFAAVNTTFSDVTGTEYEEAVTVLSALEVISGYDDGTYKPENIVTRAEMAVLIVQLIGLGDRAANSSSSFPDTADGYGWADGYIGYAQGLGIIAGYPNGTFQPGNTVTHEEALTMVVSAIGYTTALNEMNGTWPANFVSKAKALGVSDNVKDGGSNGANRGDIAMYLYNSLTCTYGYANNGIFISYKDGDGNPMKMINNLDAEVQGPYVIDGKEDSLINIKKYVGAYAETFVMTKGTYKNYIVAVGEVESEEITGVYDPEEMELTVGSTTYSIPDNLEVQNYFFNGDSVTRSSNSTIDTLVNSKDYMVEDPGLDDINLTFHVDKTGKTIKEIYSLMYWDVSDHAIIESDDLTDIADGSLFGIDFAEDDNDDIDLTSFQLYGADSLDDISVGDVVYVYENEDEEISRIDVGTDTAEGTVSRVSSDGKTVTISGTQYYYAQNKLSENGGPGEIGTGEISASDEVILYLDAYGYIYDYDLSDGTADNYAIYLNGAYDGGLSGGYQVKLVLNDGSVKVFDVKDDAIADGIKNVTIGAVNELDTDWIASPGQIIKYGTNKNGEINSIEDFDSNSDYRVSEANPTTGTYSPLDTYVEGSISSKGIFKSRTILNNAVIFNFDYDVNAATLKQFQDGDNYSVGSRASILDSDDATATYVTYKGDIAAILLYDYSSGDDVYGIPVEINEVDENYDYEIIFLVDGKRVPYVSDTPAYTVANAVIEATAQNIVDGATDSGIHTPGSAGPLFLLKFDADGDVKSLAAAYDKSTLEKDANFCYEKVANIKGTPTTSKIEFTGGEVYNYGSSYTTIYANTGKDNKMEVKNNNYLRNLASGSVDIYFYDTDDDGYYDVIIVME